MNTNFQLCEANSTDKSNFSALRIQCMYIRLVHLISCAELKVDGQKIKKTIRCVKESISLPIFRCSFVY